MNRIERVKILSPNNLLNTLYHGVHANIPRKKNAKTNNSHMDWLIYQARHMDENTFANLKHFRALSSRYDKLLNSFIGTVAFACGLIWLKL